MEEKPKEYKKYEAARNALSKLMDEYGHDETLQAMVDCLADAVGMDVIAVLVDSIKEKEKKRYAEMQRRISWEIQHKQDVKNGKYIKQLKERGKDRNFRKQLIERGKNDRRI